MRTILLLTLAACDFHASATATPEVDGGATVADSRPPGTPFTPCPGYKSLGDALEPSSYRVVTTRVQFKAAELSCEASQGHLVILDSDTEATLVVAATASAAIVGGWIGFSDLRNDDMWIDVAGRASSYMAARWAVNEPSMGGGNENCASLIGVASLKASNCGNSDGGMGDIRGYVCECGDGVQGNPRNFLHVD
jgi:lectin-like protein